MRHNRWKLVTVACFVSMLAMFAPTAHGATLISWSNAQITDNPGPWTTINSPGSWRKSPNLNDSGPALSNGTQVELICYLYGAPAGQYGNTLWYWAYSGSTSGFINDHYLNTPGTAGAPQPQVGHCTPTAGSGNGGVTSGNAFVAINSPGVWGNSPTFAKDKSVVGVNNNDRIILGCYVYGAATGPYGNTLWYIASDTTNATHGWINDHYLNTPGTASSPQPQARHC